MAWYDRAFHTFESVMMAPLNFLFGFDNSAENYYRPNQDAAPEIHIHTDQVSVAPSLDLAAAQRAAREQSADGAMQADRGQAPLPEPAPDINARDWDIANSPMPSAPQPDVAFYTALAEPPQLREQEQSAGLAR